MRLTADARLKGKREREREGDRERERRWRLVKYVIRTEAVRAGFKHCYDQSDYATIVAVAAKLPEKVIQEDEKLLMVSKLLVALTSGLHTRPAVNADSVQ